MDDRDGDLDSQEQISRVRRSRLDAGRSYDRLSRWYDLLTGPDRRITRIGLDWLALRPEERVLDLGCGTGSALVELARITGEEAVQAFGCDLSARMLARTRDKLHLAGVSAGLIRADAARLPFVDASFDALLLSFTLELFDTPEIPFVLAEIRRILRRGGRLLAISLAKTDHPGAMERSYEWLHSHLENLADCRPIYAQKFLKEAGFQVSQSLRVSLWGLPVDILLTDQLT